MRGLAIGADRALYVAASQRGGSRLGQAAADREQLVLARVVAGQVGWTRIIDAGAGPVAASAELVVAAVSGTGSVRVDTAALPVRGNPGAALLGLAPASGDTRWATGVGATEWVVVAALAARPGGGVVLAGSFAGTLRVGDHVVSAAGGSDGFVAAVDGSGRPLWLVRAGGDGADGFTAVAADTDFIAAVGAVTGDADVGGVPVAGTDDQTLAPDVRVAGLGADGAPRWAQAVGGEAEDAAAGVVLTGDGVVVGATSRGVVTRVGQDLGLEVGGAADALVVRFDRAGRALGAALVGGTDYDGARALVARPGGATLFGWFAGTLPGGGTGAGLIADGGDDAFAAELDAGGALLGAATDRDRSALSGAGREEITAAASGADTQAIAVSYSNRARVFGVDLPAPAQPLAGAALVVRAVAPPR